VLSGFVGRSPPHDVAFQGREPLGRKDGAARPHAERLPTSRIEQYRPTSLAIQSDDLNSSIELNDVASRLWFVPGRATQVGSLRSDLLLERGPLGPGHATDP